MSSWRSPTHGPLAAAPTINTNLQEQQQQQQNGPRAKCDQVVFEAIAKAAEIIVGSRCWIENMPGSNSSSRFNLLVPEVQGVRSILQRWKRALHVPLRLDVYYQHEDSRRELLERWCLEYAPKTTYSFQHGSSDPIVQIRQVCKQIVIWLRTLYGWSRMLPAQALRQRNGRGNDNHVGFSIYVVSEGNDDVTGLVSNQGFSTQGQPHSVLTPYGELGWKVFYAPKPMIQQLIPEVPAYTTNSAHVASSISSNNSNRSRSRAISQPIPMNNNSSDTHGIRNNNNHTAAAWSSDHNKRDPNAARSAPGNQRSTAYHRSNSDFGSSAPRQAPVMSPRMRRNSAMPMVQQHQVQQMQHPQDPAAVASSPASSNTASKPPTKNLSALSLAMMMSDDKNKSNEDGETREAAEKRRAALHHAPPQFVNNTSPAAVSPVLKPSNLATAGEYGYGYNNHLPNMRALSASGGMRHDHGSPGHAATTPLSSTPPGYLLGAGPTPPNSVPPVSSLIPPRSSVTPPFVRPAGFVGEPPSQPLSPAASLPAPAATPDVSTISLNQQTSLDLLHSSPFQQPASVFSISNTPLDGEQRQLFNLNDLRPMVGGTLLDPRYRSEDFYYEQAYGSNLDDLEDNNMPFAVDSYSASALTMDKGGASENNPLLSSASGVASFATAPPKRLALFDSMGASQQNDADNKHKSATADDKTAEDDTMESLADQLAEFKMFGTSLIMGGSEASSSTSTPISLRT